MSGMKTLTKRQTKALNFIKSHLEKRGYPPSQMEVAKHMGSDYPNTGQSVINALISKGYLFRTPGVSRGLKVNGK